MPKVSKSIDKAFAIISCIGSALKSVDNKTPEFARLELHANNMMKVYSVQVGREHYWDVSNRVKDVWVMLIDKYGTEIHEDSVCELVNAYATLMQPKTFNTLLKVPQPVLGQIKLHKEGDFAKICNSALSLDEALNKEFGTKSIVLVKPSVKKVKIKKERTKSKKVSKHEKEVLEAKAKKERKKTFLAGVRKRAEEARANV